MIYVVLGMHKSGTTLVSRILHESGINMSDSFAPGLSYDYERDKYERTSIQKLNRDLLSCYSTRSFDIKLKGPLSVTEAQRERMQEIIEDCSHKYSDWGFKDPRTCLTYPAWAQELPFHKVLVVFRSYTEILGHYQVSGWKQVRLLKLRKVLRAWTQHNRQIIDHIQSTKQPYIALSYEALMMDDHEFERLSRFVGRPLIDARDPQQYRSRSKNSYRMSLAGQIMALTLPDNPLLILNRLHELCASASQ